jgi:aldehyde dehydrogenase (NAD+)
MRTISKIYVDGEFVTPHGTATLDLISPTTNEKMAVVTLGDEIDTMVAITAAKQALPTWKKYGL